jgi:SAM-dependent methyltransferase
VTATASELVRRRGSYGIDAPYVPLFMSAGAAVAIVVAIGSAFAGMDGLAVAAAYFAFFLTLSVADYLYASLFGKFAVWAKLLRSLGLRGDERVLDLGCGRGAVLLMAAKLVPRGRAVGIDLWRASDQLGNALEVTKRNADLEGVADHVDLWTGDMRALPFENDSFDVVISSLAIHNITDADGRAKAIDEAVRVLQPGGRIVIVDIGATPEYETRLRERGMTDLARRPLGPRFWFGNPWVAGKLLTGRKPR